jgi:hypothetical protein
VGSCTHDLASHHDVPDTPDGAMRPTPEHFGSHGLSH